MAVERAAAGRVIAMGQVADVVRIGEEAAYAEAREAVEQAMAVERVKRVVQDAAELVAYAARMEALAQVAHDAEVKAYDADAEARETAWVLYRAVAAKDVEVETYDAAYAAVADAKVRAAVAWVEANKAWDAANAPHV
jgi:hypothetical protein